MDQDDEIKSLRDLLKTATKRVTSATDYINLQLKNDDLTQTEKTTFYTVLTMLTEDEPITKQ